MQIRRNQFHCQRVKQKIKATADEYKEKNEALARERDSITRHYRQLKQKMSLFRAHQQQRLRDLTMQAREVTNGLKEKIQLAEHILTVAEVNRKLETDREKITPFFPVLAETDPEIQEQLARMDEQTEQAMGFSLAPRLQVASSGGGAGTAAGAAGASSSSGGEGGAEEATGSENKLVDTDYSALNQFFKRVNKVTLDKMAIEHEYQRLQAENEALRTLLRQYMDAININSSVSNSEHPLLIVKPATLEVLNTAAHGQAQASPV